MTTSSEIWVKFCRAYVEAYKRAAYSLSSEDRFIVRLEHRFWARRGGSLYATLHIEEHQVDGSFEDLPDLFGEFFEHLSIRGLVTLTITQLDC